MIMPFVARENYWLLLERKGNTLSWELGVGSL